MEDHPPAKKRRRHSLARVLHDAERSSLVAGEEGEPSDTTPELWLLQLPRELDVAALDGVEVDLRGSSPDHIVVSGEEEKGYAMTATPFKAGQEPSDVLLLPSSRPGRLVVGPPISGRVDVRRSVTLLPVKLPEEEERRVEFPRGLKQRWKPFGWRRPLVSGAPRRPLLVSGAPGEEEQLQQHKGKKTKKSKKKKSHNVDT